MQLALWVVASVTTNMPFPKIVRITTATIRITTTVTTISMAVERAFMLLIGFL